jgi:hypothetical protein
MMIHSLDFNFNSSLDYLNLINKFFIDNFLISFGTIGILGFFILMSGKGQKIFDNTVKLIGAVAGSLLIIDKGSNYIGGSNVENNKFEDIKPEENKKDSKDENNNKSDDNNNNKSDDTNKSNDQSDNK